MITRHIQSMFVNNYDILMCFRCIGNNKCNTDGASSGNPGISSYGGIFRDHEANCIGYFSEPLGVSTSYQAELQGALRAI